MLPQQAQPHIRDGVLRRHKLDMWNVRQTVMTCCELRRAERKNSNVTFHLTFLLLFPRFSRIHTSCSLASVCLTAMNPSNHPTNRSRSTSGTNATGSSSHKKSSTNANQSTFNPNVPGQNGPPK